MSKIDGIDLNKFSALVSIKKLQESNCAEVPSAKGVYLVIGEKFERPEFLKKSEGGWFKGKNPSCPIKFLEEKWVKSAKVLYVGKASSQKGLKQRLRQYLQFGQGRRVGHRGGRLIWQLKNNKQLFICWQEVGRADPRHIESNLIRAFTNVYGVRPFANLIK